MNDEYINHSMSITDGLQIDSPSVFLPWNSLPDDIETIFKDYPINMITSNYYVIKNAQVFESLRCNLGLHYNTYLEKLEFFRDEYLDYEGSYTEFQKVFEEIFGEPTIIHSKKSCEWRINNNIKIFHNLMDRFGWEERLFIEKM